MSRHYFGHIGVIKVNKGPKSVNVNIDRDQGLELAVAIIRACNTQKRLDLAFFPEIVYKRSGGKNSSGQDSCNRNVHTLAN
jgi:hypothetical protein